MSGYAADPGTLHARKRLALEFFRANPNGRIGDARAFMRKRYGRAIDSYVLADIRNQARAESRLPPVGKKHAIKSVLDKRASIRLPPQLELVDGEPPKVTPPPEPSSEPFPLTPTERKRIANETDDDRLNRKLARLCKIAESIAGLARLEIVVDDYGRASVRYTVREEREHVWGVD